EAGLALRGKSITIRGREGGGPRPTIWLTHDGRKAAMTALLLQADRVTLQGVRVVISGDASPMTGVRLSGGVRPRREGGRLGPGHPSYRGTQRLGWVEVDGTAGTTVPLLTLKGCVFVGAEELEPGGDRRGFNKLGRGGHDALVRRGPGQIEAIQCAFAPHRSC